MLLRPHDDGRGRRPSSRCPRAGDGCTPAACTARAPGLPRPEARRRSRRGNPSTSLAGSIAASTLPDVTPEGSGKLDQDSVDVLHVDSGRRRRRGAPARLTAFGSRITSSRRSRPPLAAFSLVAKRTRRKQGSSPAQHHVETRFPDRAARRKPAPRLRPPRLGPALQSTFRSGPSLPRVPGTRPGAVHKRGTSTRARAAGRQPGCVGASVARVRTDADAPSSTLGLP